MRCTGTPISITYLVLTSQAKCLSPLPASCFALRRHRSRLVLMPAEGVLRLVDNVVHGIPGLVANVLDEILGFVSRGFDRVSCPVGRLFGRISEVPGEILGFISCTLGGTSCRINNISNRVLDSPGDAPRSGAENDHRPAGEENVDTGQHADSPFARHRPLALDHEPEQHGDDAVEEHPAPTLVGAGLERGDDLEDTVDKKVEGEEQGQ